MTVLTRYVSPFGSPACLDAALAEQLLVEDAALWRLMDDAGILTERQLRIGPPRIGDNQFRLSEMPEWVDGDDFEVLRPLVARCEQLTRERGEEYVVACREGRSTVMPRRLVIEGDDVRWPWSRA
jgi:hypothetical protein